MGGKPRKYCLLLLLIPIILASYWGARVYYLSDERAGDLRRLLPRKATMIFFALGDTGTGDENQFRVATAMEEHCNLLGGIDAILLLGDNFYQTGVNGPDDPQFIDKIEKPYGGPCLSQAPFIPVLGNHDYKGNTGAQIAYSRKNPRWLMPHRFHSVTFGDLVRIVGFDTNFPDACLSPDHCAIDFLRGELAGPATRWSIVLAHRPLLSSSEDHFSYSGESPLDFLFRSFMCQRADAWLSGHAHHLEHLEMPGCRSSLFVAGGGGGDLRNIGDKLEESRFAAVTFGFLELKLDDNLFASAFVDPSGRVLHEFQKHH